MLTYAKASQFVESYECIVALKREIAELRTDIKGLKSFIRNSGGEQMKSAERDLVSYEHDLAILLKDLDKNQTKLNNLKYKD